MFNPSGKRLTLLIFLNALLPIAMLSLALKHIPDAYADDQTDALIRDELSEQNEEPPKPEYPYPGAAEPGMSKTEEHAQAPVVKERPVRIDDDDNYYYDTSTKESPIKHPTKETPKQTKEGEFIYENDTEPVKPSGRKGVEKPIETTAAGEYYYPTDKPKLSRSASFRFGLFDPPGLKNDQTGQTFKDVYSESAMPILLLDYEWHLTSAFGHLGLKIGSGLFSAQGHGVFKVKIDRRKDDVPPERYTFLLFPNTATAIYRFQYKETQFIVPFVEGGLGYFTFAELRDDGATPRIGGAAVAVAAGGVNFLADAVDRRSMRLLTEEYGIAHVWLTTEARGYVNLGSRYDFTTLVINLGILMDF